MFLKTVALSLTCSKHLNCIKFEMELLKRTKHQIRVVDFEWDFSSNRHNVYEFRSEYVHRLVSGSKRLEHCPLVRFDVNYNLNRLTEVKSWCRIFLELRNEKRKRVKQSLHISSRLTLTNDYAR